MLHKKHQRKKGHFMLQKLIPRIHLFKLKLIRKTRHITKCRTKEEDQIIQGLKEKSTRRQPMIW
jgi:hypothetical protein